MIRIVIVDDHDLMRTGMRLMLSDDPEFSVIAEGESGLDALRLVRQHRPDVLLLDLNMPGTLSGFEALERVKAAAPETRVIIVSMHTELPVPRKMLDAGAWGYLSKNCSAAELQSGIRKVVQGRRYVSPDIAQLLALASGDEGRESPFLNLSPREIEVTLALTHGTKAHLLAQRLNVSPKTIATYKSRLLSKLGVGNEAELSRLAIAWGLVPEAVVPSKLKITKNES